MLPNNLYLGQCIFLLLISWWKSLSCVWLFVTPWTVAHESPLSMGFSRQEYWSGLPCPPPGDLPDPGIEPRSPALQADSLSSESPGKPSFFLKVMIISFPSFFFYDLGYKNRCAWSNFSSQAYSHTYWAGQEREDGFVSGPLNSRAFIPGMKESFPHFTLLELTEKKEWKSNEGYCIWNNSKSVGYIFDCFYYHKASSFFFTVGKVYIFYCNLKNNNNK